MKHRAAQLGSSMRIFVIARIVEFIVIVAGVFVSEVLRTGIVNASDPISLKTVFFIPVAFYIGFGYLFVSLMAFIALGLMNKKVTRRRLMIANVVPLFVWWLFAAFYVYGSDIPAAFTATWLIAVVVNAAMAWKIANAVTVQQ